MSEATAAPSAGSVYLLGSGSPQSRLFREMLDRAFASVGGRTPRVALSLAPIAGNHAIIGRMLGWFMSKTFRGADVQRFTVDGEGSAMPPEQARAIVERADLVFVSGGDPVLGARLLTSGGADGWLRAARARGASLSGGSAGAIVLGAFWAEWPEEPPPGAPFDGGRLVPCTGVVDDLVVDTHDEDDGWSELAQVHGMLRLAGREARVIGVPTHGAVAIDGSGQLEAFGEPYYEST